MVRALPSEEVGVVGVVRARPVRVGGVDVLVGRLETGEVVAFGSTCPHQGTDLGDAALVDGCVRCPQHGYSYDAVTGESVEPGRRARAAGSSGELWRLKPGYLRVHPVEERDGWIWVGLEPLPAPPSYDPSAEEAPSPRAVVAGREVLQVAVGATFELHLGAGRPGYVWRFDAGGHGLAVVESRVEGGSQLVRVAARAAGRATLRCSYGRPWDPEPAELRVYEVVVSA